MKLIPNLTQYAQKCLRYGRIDKSKPYRSIRAIIIYLHTEHNMTKDEILDSVWTYVQDCNMEHKVSYNYLKDEYIKTVISTITPQVEITSINITKKEMDFIMNNKYPHSYRKVLFVILVIYKTKYMNNGVKNDKIEATDVEILKDAHVTMTKDKRTIMWRTFNENGLVTLGSCKDGDTLHLHYVDYNEEEIVLEVTDFDDYYMFFEQYVKGGKLIYCQKCGKLVLTKTKGRPSNYCDKCAKIVKNKQIEECKKRKKGEV